MIGADRRIERFDHAAAVAHAHRRHLEIWLAQRWDVPSWPVYDS
jgi:hypothetical protein